MPDGVDLRGFTALASAAATSADDPDPTEQALLGALLTQGRLLEALPRGPGGFTVHCFADERHRRIYRAIEDVYDAAAVDAPIALVGPKLCDGDAALRHYLVLLPRAARSYQPETIARMGRVLAERHLRARIIEELQAGVRDAGAVPPRALAARLVASLDLLTTEDPEGHRAVLLGEAVDAAMAKVEAARMKGGPTGIATGIPDLDRALLNMDRQELILIGGRTGMGKTTLAMAIARGRAHLAYGEMQGQGEFQGGIYVGSLEMSSPQLAMRMLASEAGVSYESMQLGQVGAAEMEFLADARRRLNPLPMVIDDAANQTMGMLAAGARDAARKFGRLSLVVIDHATIVKPDDKSAATRNPVFMFSAISNAAKRMAKELDVPVLLLVQLNRNVENRENKRPQMSDLNWSGSFEQDADTVIFVYREWYYLNQEGPPQRKDGEADTIFSARLATYNQRLREAENALEAIVAKLRRGKPRTLNMYFDGDTNTIRGLDLHHVA